MKAKAWVFRATQGAPSRYRGMWVVDCNACDKSDRNAITGSDWHLSIVADWDNAMDLANEHITAHRLKETADELVASWTKTAEVFVGTGADQAGRMAAACAIELGHRMRL